jgi:hypothetical protein
MARLSSGAQPTNAKPYAVRLVHGRGVVLAAEVLEVELVSCDAVSELLEEEKWEVIDMG